MTRIEVRALKYDGKLHRSWPAEIIAREDDLLIVRGVFAAEVRHALLGTIERGTISTEYYWMDRHYSVFRFVTPSGRLRNYYCNIHLPPTITASPLAPHDHTTEQPLPTLTFIDLDVDVLVAPDLTYRVLDEDEYEVNARLYHYPPEIHALIANARAELIRMIADRRYPFRTEERENETFKHT